MRRGNFLHTYVATLPWGNGPEGAPRGSRLDTPTQMGEGEGGAAAGLAVCPLAHPEKRVPNAKMHLQYFLRTCS